MRVLIQTEIVEHQLVSHKFALAAGDRVDAGEQFAGIEGLGEIVVRPDVQPQHLVADLRFCGEHQHGRGDLFPADGLQKGDSVHFRHHDVEDDDVVEIRHGVVVTVLPVVNRFRFVFMLF